MKASMHVKSPVFKGYIWHVPYDNSPDVLSNIPGRCVQAR